MSRIEQLISDIEAYIDNCKYQPFSNNKIIVDKDQLEDMLSELRLKTPDEIKKVEELVNHALHVAQYQERPGRTDFCDKNDHRYRRKN